MKKYINKLFEKLGYVPKVEYDHIQHKYLYLLKEMNEYDCLYEAIGKCDSIINYKVYGNDIWGYGVMVNFGNTSRLVKFYPNDYGVEYARLCAEELCEKLNKRI